MNFAGQPQQVHQFARSRRYKLGDYASGPALPYIQEWIGAIGFFKGALWPQLPLSTKTILCVTDLVNGLIVDGVWDKLLVVNPYVPDSLNACFTPVLNRNNSGFRQWSPAGAWAPGDLSIGGLTGDAATKWLDTGFNVGNQFPNPPASSMAVYSATVTASGYSAGAYSANGFIVAADMTDGEYKSFNGAQTPPNNFIHAATAGAGFYCYSRVSTTDHRVYFGKSITPFAQIGATDNTAFVGSFPLINALVHAIRLAPNTPQLPTSDQISFVAIGDGLTGTDAGFLFNRVQNYRQSMGGGFV